MYQSVFSVGYYVQYVAILFTLFSFTHSDQPIAASFPHFCKRSGPWDKYIDGLSPNESIHDSYTIVEPNYGVPMKQKAVSQSNVILKDLSSYKSDFARFSNMIIPMFWLEYVTTNNKN